MAHMELAAVFCKPRASLQMTVASWASPFLGAAGTLKTSVASGPKGSECRNTGQVRCSMRNPKYGVGYTWTSKMAKIMDPILSILGYWGHYFGFFWRSRYTLYLGTWTLSLGPSWGAAPISPAPTFQSM